MRKLYALAILTVFLMLTFTSNSYALFANAKVTINVVDEDDVPVDDARVGIAFDDHRSKSKENSVIGVSDSEGLFVGSETTASGYLFFNVTKNGYYKSTGDYQFKNKKIFGWEPWNPELKIVLRKIENPVPMYARDTRIFKIEIPVIGKDVGFDLIKFDWVTPYGSGAHGDFIFNLEKVSRGPKDFEYKVMISFPNKNDGLIKYEENLRHGSQLKLPRNAPLDGYLNHKELYVKRGLNIAKRSWKRNVGYIFRVRTEENDGQFEKGLYGKIIGDFDIGTKSKGTADIEFFYYLNPDYTGNLEFDPEQNLF